MSSFDTPAHRDFLHRIAAGIAQGPYDADWDSLRGVRTPEWYRDGKFGIFIHWGVYAVPAYGNEWYPRNMYVEGSDAFAHHVATYGSQESFGYKDFIEDFTADRFDATAWARLFRRAGAQFVVPVAEHHDGFAMYECSFSRWNAALMGPKRDVIKELADAVRDQSMVFGLSSHRAEHWWFFNGGTRFPSDVLEPETLDLYGPANRQELQPTEPFLEDWLVRTAELVDRYHPQLVWFDWWIEQPAFAPYLKQFAAYYYNRGEEWGRGVSINHKYEAFPEGTAVFDVERGQLSGIRADFWQTDTSVSKNSWSYVVDQEYKGANDLIADLVDIVSKNGALLLNIGPKADGTIPEPEITLLETIGDWLSVNGEAIYGTRPWLIPGEGPTPVAEGAFTDTDRPPYTPEDIRFTTARGDLYATVLGEGAAEVRIRSLGSAAGLCPDEIRDVRLLGHAGTIAWRRTLDALVVELPEGARALPVLRIQLVPKTTEPRTAELVQW